ncbi:MAG: hypothetical protein FJ144_25290 [Deltaproteobacteria bacterium]|nr:hypothetical protein [Deltaproteobacteria bacterium]
MLADGPRTSVTDDAGVRRESRHVQDDDSPATGKRLLTIALSALVALLIVEIALHVAHLALTRFGGRGGADVAATDKFRILTIGDSNTYGLGMTREAAYPAQLERRLNASVGEEKFEVINLGVPGLNSSQALQYLPKYVELYEPDLLLVLTGVNDYWNPAESNTDAAESLRNRIHRLLSHLRIYRLIVLVWDYYRFGAAGGDATLRTLQTRKETGDADDATVHELHFGDETFSFRNERRPLVLTAEENEARTSQNIAQIIEVAAAARVPLVLPTYAANTGHYSIANGAIQSSSGALVVPQTFADHLARRIPRPRPGPDKLFFPDLHPKAPVYAAYAQNLCEALAREHVVPIEECTDTP